MEAKGKDRWLMSTPKKFASGSQGHLHDKSPVFLNICHIYQQQPVLSLKPLAKPIAVFLSPSVPAASACFPLPHSHAFLALVVVSFVSDSSLFLCQTNHTHISTLNSVRKVTLVGGSHVQFCPGHPPSPQTIPKKGSGVGTERSPGVTTSRRFQCSFCFSTVPILKQKRPWHYWRGQAMLCYCTPMLQNWLSSSPNTGLAYASFVQRTGPGTV